MSQTAKDAARQSNMTPAVLMASIEDVDNWDDKVLQATNVLKRTKDQRKMRRAHWANEGVNLKVMDEIRAMKKEDTADVRQNEEDRVRYMKWQGIEPVGFQGGFEFQQATAEEEEARIKHDATLMGKAAARRGDPRSANPLSAEPGSVAFVAWDTGWQQGTDEDFDGASPARTPRKGRGAEAKGKKNQAPSAAPGADTAGAGEQPTAPTQPEPPEDAGESALDIPAELAGAEDNA